jgi:hypothetical protein
MTTIPLGFEVHAGGPVAIPLKHLAITGQTQEAGKTTALEALITRAGVRAVTFVTKRGEGAFVNARRIDPYFREQADWQFVASILEASRGEKLKFERAWIIRASRGARTLADVHRNVKRAQEKATGLSADVYLTLDAYLEIVVPQIARVRWAPALSLSAGVNAMDLTGLTVELQHLVIKSALDWILEHAADTVVVVPEAWKFIPQGRNTPVKLAAESFIRQAAALQNYLWLDSQDLGGIDKTILRSVPVWLLGVQREANEIARTLANIPAGVHKPKAADLALLGLGEFYACYGKYAIRTYVQPAWLSADEALEVALGTRPALGRAWRQRIVTLEQQEDTVNKADAEALQRDNETLRRENAQLRQAIEHLEGRIAHAERGSTTAAVPARHAGAARESRANRAGDDAPTSAPRGGAAAPGASPGATAANVDEDLYQAIKARLVAEAPHILEVVLAQPEIEITIQRPRLQFEEHSLKWRIVRLLRDQLFKGEPLSCGQIRSALKRTGPDANTANIGRAMADLVRAGIFTDEGSGYRPVPGIPVRTIEGEQ